jgi:hypothetical protein
MTDAAITVEINPSLRLDKIDGPPEDSSLSRCTRATSFA